MAAEISDGQSVNGMIPREDGKAIRMIPTGSKPRRSTNALVKCVVPIITFSISAGATPDDARTSLIASTMPSLTFSVVGDLWAANTAVPPMTTASVLVPPTSTPILMIRISSESPSQNSRKSSDPNKHPVGAEHLARVG